MLSLERSNHDKRDGTRAKFNCSCIKRAILSGDITAEFAHIGCNYCHSEYARLSLIASGYTYMSAAETVPRIYGVET